MTAEGLWEPFPGVISQIQTSAVGLGTLQRQGLFPGAILASGGQGRYLVLTLDKALRKAIQRMPGSRLERQLAELGLQVGIGEDARLATIALREIAGEDLTTLHGEVFDLPDDRVTDSLRKAFLAHNHIDPPRKILPGTIVSLFGTPIGLQVARVHLWRLRDAGETPDEPIEEALSWIAYQLAEPDRRTAALIMRYQRRFARQSRPLPLETATEPSGP